MAKKPKKAKPPKDPNKVGRIKQIRQSYTMTKKSDPRIGLILPGVFLLAGLAGFAVMLLVFRSLFFPIVFGVLVGLLAALIVFGRRAQAAAISQIEGKPGAAAAALGMLKRGWKTEPAIAITKQQDVVTRVVGPPGIVLIGEGNVNRLRPCSPRSAASTSGWPARPRSTRSSSGTTPARSRWPSSPSTSPSSAASSSRRR